MRPSTLSRSGLRVVCLVAACLAASGVDAKDDFHYQASTLNAQQLDAYLAGKHVKGRATDSPMVHKGNSLLQQGQIYDVDPRLIVAIAGQESSFGIRVCAANNAWNWFWGGSCSRSPFESYDNGIRTLNKFMRRSYLNKGYTTIPLIGKKYCVDGCEHWRSGVDFFYGQLVTLQSQPAIVKQPAEAAPTPVPAPQPTPQPQTAASGGATVVAPSTLEEPKPPVTKPPGGATVVMPGQNDGAARIRLLLEGAGIGILLIAVVVGVVMVALRFIGARRTPMT